MIREARARGEIDTRSARIEDRNGLAAHWFEREILLEAPGGRDLRRSSDRESDRLADPNGKQLVNKRNFCLKGRAEADR